MQIGLLTIHCLEDAMALFSDSMNHDLLSIIKKKHINRKNIFNKKKIADKTKKDHFICGIKLLSVLVLFALSAIQTGYAKPAIEFNTDALDIGERANIDLDKFARAGYIMPGHYIMGVRVNKNEFPEMYPIDFIAPPDDPKGSEACISPELVKQIVLKPEWMEKLSWQYDGKCLDLNTLPGVSARGDLATYTLYLIVPKIYLEYDLPDWDPPSRWDNGIAGLLFDYNVNAQTSKPSHGSSNQQISANGTTGMNAGAWRFRADWQARYNRFKTKEENKSDNVGERERKWDWSRYYAYRALPRLEAKLTLGEDYLNSNIFDSFRYTGVSLVTDENMLPPNLRGYAPEVTGVARTNAKVTVSQQGRILYETQVASGPFRIQDLSDAVAGTLDVRVEEQDGGIQQFQVNTATIPYLTRPGRVQYKLVGGQSTNDKHRREGPAFGLGEFSWGINNGWSLYGGLLAAGDYNALSLGLGRDLMMFGALSFDVTESRARLPGENKTLTGGSYRLSYSKRFDEYNSQITFAGYRFSERNFMNMGQYIDRRYRNVSSDSGKELYTIIFNKQFTDIGLSTHFNYSHQTYWNRPANDRYNISLSKYVDVGRYKNISVSLSAYRNNFDNKKDDGAYLNLSIPWGDSSTFSYGGMVNRQDNAHTVSYFDRIDDRNNYRISAGSSMGGRASADGYYTHYGDKALLTASASYQDGGNTAAALGLQGGMTITANGAALHRINMPGATRLMVDTEGVSNVPVRGFGSAVHTNYFGKAVLVDVNNYYRNTANIDLDNLPEDVEALRSVQQATLTEGAIGYRKFQVMSGLKALTAIRLPDGSFPPFGASVMNAAQRELGIVSDDGYAYLSGMNQGEKLKVYWDGRAQCEIIVPDNISSESLTEILLPCQFLKGDDK
ncbi:outer membrane usher protein [Xenorhabdus nematophila]|uniref:Outer membrane usher protein, MrxC n=2 Tax=Xenorhabdus nematophila TaxID=628 RepID=D3VB57_XENNA|nr:outer membrane usher protein [Xenorhabdus nematophila]CEF28761.1 Outer membrane usher protein, MrxC [Xenorhabdus nematophila str. Websteri]AYA42312.1 outer membrane usher protein [Xenorhabdus nematophila]MBA0021041.1 outer membrane usher protein [Xenorhabdus nematophila]MCB4424867.1 outer membrane usher protein [Xenorhabdus nematophila]QNJ36683.1 outer membrane usher protein [Xenorhabdus nematophila]